MSYFWTVLILFGVLAGFVLLVDHRNHLFGPYGDYIWIVLLLICPLLHVILHRGHAHGRSHYHHDTPDSSSDEEDPDERS